LVYQAALLVEDMRKGVAAASAFELGPIGLFVNRNRHNLRTWLLLGSNREIREIKKPGIKPGFLTQILNLDNGAQERT
jgi:hypothetical protein